MTDTTVTQRNALSFRERAIALAPKIAERAAEVDKMRHVHDDSIAELIDSGLTRAMQPRQWGGEEGDPADFYSAVVEISKACTSTGWVLCILGMHNWEMAHMSQQLGEELFGDDPTTMLSSSYAQQGTAEVVPGGYRLNGRWKSSSGVHHATWTVVGADVLVGDRKIPHNFVVPHRDVEIIDDWYTLGLRGTGSRSVVLDNVFVPAYRAIDREVLLAKAGPGLAINTGPLYNVSQGVLYTAVAAAPALGAGWAFYDEFKKQSGKYKRRIDGAQLGLEKNILLRIAEARGLLSDAETISTLRQREAYDRALAGGSMTMAETARSIYDVSRCGRAVQTVAANLLPNLTASVVYDSNPLQRIYRDILTARQHGTQNVDLSGVSMASLEMGQDPAHIFLLSDEKLKAARERGAKLCYT